jgi:DNA-binding transcriptional LysR family regulator
MPKGSIETLSISVIAHFLADGRFISAMPRSVAYFCGLKVLPVALPLRPWPVHVASLKNRTLSPVVDRFIAFARDFTRRAADGRPSSKR